MISLNGPALQPDKREYGCEELRDIDGCPVCEGFCGWYIGVSADFLVCQPVAEWLWKRGALLEDPTE